MKNIRHIHEYLVAFIDSSMSAGINMSFSAVPMSIYSTEEEGFLFTAHSDVKRIIFKSSKSYEEYRSLVRKD